MTNFGSKPINFALSPNLICVCLHHMCFYAGKFRVSNMHCAVFSVCFFADFAAHCSFLLALCSAYIHAPCDCDDVLVAIVVVSSVVVDWL